MHSSFAAKHVDGVNGQTVKFLSHLTIALFSSHNSKDSRCLVLFIVLRISFLCSSLPKSVLVWKCHFMVLFEPWWPQDATKLCVPTVSHHLWGWYGLGSSSWQVLPFCMFTFFKLLPWWCYVVCLTIDVFFKTCDGQFSICLFEIDRSLAFQCWRMTGIWHACYRIFIIEWKSDDTI